MIKYRNLIDHEIPDMLGHLKYLPQELYTEVSRLCLRMLSRGIYVGANAPPNAVAFGIVDSIHSQTPFTENERNAIQQLGTVFFVLGTKIKEPNKDELLLHAAESVEYVAERLGCKDYCGEAMSWLLKVDTKGNES